VPRDHWIESWEREAILAYRLQYPLESYRRLSFMMLDADLAAVSPSTVYRVLRGAGMTHVWTPRYYPQSNGIIERWHQTLKIETLRPRCPDTKEEAERLVEEHVQHYNHVRLHSAIGYITPMDKLAGRENEIWVERDRRLDAARKARREKRLCA
jgi:hypothetical protein